MNHPLRDGWPDDAGFHEPEQFDDMTGPHVPMGTVSPEHTARAENAAMDKLWADMQRTPPARTQAGATDGPVFDADAFVKANYTPIQIGYMLTGDWDSIAAAMRRAYLQGRLDGGCVIALAAGVDLRGKGVR